ncbi:class I SAM-dependent methyltransferase [Allorhizocola rhizosphaerae]|uniref:class I SAM-dependent methyltransferase n=1 Tax=Allorhizocola rhizosphaerae TaxID=1872709 RepID=UPI000E3BEFE1|nr:class I SAM-dependent methyltransferase [Allorhizocola rhizosphaerae]
MNRIHNRLCRSDSWFDKIEHEVLPWALRGIELGDDVLEIGPGFGATTKVLAPMVPRLTALEIDPALAGGLRHAYGDTVDVIHGDGTAIPLPDSRFSAVVCFTMLHHVPSPALQDRIFAEACRVLRPRGVFAGSDSVPTLRWRIIHIGDTRVVVDPATLPDRLAAAGFTDIHVDVAPRKAVKFRARKP